jgi:RNA polymerase sigma factor (sigma-70 family)
VSRVLHYYKVYRLNESDLMDFIAEGNVALIDCVSGYRLNHKSAAKFSTYAVESIDKRIKRFMVLNKNVHIPENYMHLRKKIEHLKIKYGEDYTDEIAMREIGVSQYVLDYCKDAKRGSVCFFEDLYGEENSVWEEKIQDKNEKIFLGDEDVVEMLKPYIDQLPNREKKIIYYMHLNGEAKTLRSASFYFKVTPERVRQIYAQALKRLKSKIIQISYPDYNRWSGQRGDPKYTFVNKEFQRNFEEYAK